MSPISKSEMLAASFSNLTAFKSKILGRGPKINCMHGRPTVKKQKQKGTRQKTYWKKNKQTLDFWVAVHPMWANVRVCLVRKGWQDFMVVFRSVASRSREETVLCLPHWLGRCLKDKLTSDGQDWRRKGRNSEKGDEDEVAVFIWVMGQEVRGPVKATRDCLIWKS